MSSIANGFLGRRVQFFWGGNSPGDDIPGVREKGIKVAGTPIDVTSGESDGWRKLLEESGQDSVDVSLSGVTKDQRLKGDFFNGSRTQAVSIVYPNGGILAGTFYLSDYSDNGPYKDATTFSASLQSTGAVTWTPGT